MYIDIARVYFYSQTDIKLTSSNGYKSQKFVSLIDAPYFKNVFDPGASIRRNTVCTKFSQNPLKDVDSRVFTRMLRCKNLTR
jgi:hypothetical protein